MYFALAKRAARALIVPALALALFAIGTALPTQAQVIIIIGDIPAGAQLELPQASEPGSPLILWASTEASPGSLFLPAPNSITYAFYPTEVEDELHVEVAASNEVLGIDIYDDSGTLVFSTTASSGSVPAPGVDAAGTYDCQIHTQEGTIYESFEKL